MFLSDTQIVKFQALYKARFGKEISKEQAYEQGIKLVRLLQLTHKPIKKVDLARLDNQAKTLSNNDN